MSELFKLTLSLSLSGSVLAVVVFACCRLLRSRLSKRFQYYIWLVVVLRLLLPISPESGIIPRLWEPAPPVQVEQQTAPPSLVEAELTETESRPAVVGQQSDEARPAPLQTPQQRNPVTFMFETLLPYLWIIWLAVAAGFMIRKITLYQSFVKYLRAGRTEVNGIETLNHFSALSEQMGMRRVIELYTNRLTASPLIIGFRRPAVVLPEIPDNDEAFRLICMHELTHYKRGDIWYKWLLQIVLCLHWFNPLVHLMVREVNRIGELSCDEAVLLALNAEEYRQYGETLLQSLQTPGTYREGLAALTLNENAKSLKERLHSIKKFSKPNRATAMLAIFLAVLLFTGGYALGAYTVKPGDVKQEEKQNPIEYEPRDEPLDYAEYEIDAKFAQSDDQNLTPLKPEILLVLQALIADYENQIDNMDFPAVPDYFALTEPKSTDDFILVATEMGLVAIINYAGASEWQIEVRISNFDGVYRAESASFSIIPDSFIGKAMARGLTFTQVKTLIHSSFSEDDILNMPVAEINRLFAMLVASNNIDERGFVNLDYVGLINMADFNSDYVYAGEEYLGWKVVEAEAVGIPYQPYLMEAESLTAVLQGSAQVTGNIRRENGIVIFTVSEESAPLTPTSTIAPSRDIIISNSAEVDNAESAIAEGVQISVIISDYSISYTSKLSYDESGDPVVENPRLIQQATVSFEG